MRERRQPQREFYEEPNRQPPIRYEKPIGSPKKKVMRGFEWFMLVLCIVIVGLVLLHEGGFRLVEKTESEEIVERPIEDGYRKQARPVRYRDEEIDKNVDEVLKDIARSFSDENGTYKQVSKRDLRKKGLDKQEASYINKVKKENEEKGTLETAKDWYKVLKASHATYSKVKNIFGDADGNQDSMIDRNTISTILGNEMLSNAVFSELEQKFNIPKERSEAFAKAGKKQLDDWAVFVEENKGQ